MLLKQVDWKTPLRYDTANKLQMPYLGTEGKKSSRNRHSSCNVKEAGPVDGML